MLISALIDVSSSALLALSARPAIIAFLAKSMDAEHVPAVNVPRYQKFPRVSPRDYPQWTWDGKNRQFLPTLAEFLTDQLRRSSALAVGKTYTLSEMSLSISIARYPVYRDTLMQDHVYMIKALQAQQFKDSKYRGDLLRYPYVLQYAQLSGLTPRVAADEILFKARLDNELLCKTEGMRLRYFNLVKDATDLNMISEIARKFRLEMIGRETIAI